MPLEYVAAVLRVLLGLVFVGMGANHFVPASARGMRAMIPPRMRGGRWPSPRVLVAASGVAEILGGLGLQVPGVRPVAGVALVVLLVALFPANAYAARHRERFGRIAVPFWPRLALQVVLAALVLVAAFL